MSADVARIKKVCPGFASRADLTYARIKRKKCRVLLADDAAGGHHATIVADGSRGVGHRGRGHRGGIVAVVGRRGRSMVAAIARAASAAAAIAAAVAAAAIAAAMAALLALEQVEQAEALPAAARMA